MQTCPLRSYASLSSTVVAAGGTCGASMAKTSVPLELSSKTSASNLPSRMVRFTGGSIATCCRCCCCCFCCWDAEPEDDLPDDPAALPEPLLFVAALELAPDDPCVLFPLPRAPDELPPLPPRLPPAPVPAAARALTTDAQTRMMCPPIVRPRPSRACVSRYRPRANLSNPHSVSHLQNHCRSDSPQLRAGEGRPVSFLFIHPP